MLVGSTNYQGGSLIRFPPSVVGGSAACFAGATAEEDVPSAARSVNSADFQYGANGNGDRESEKHG